MTERRTDLPHVTDILADAGLIDKRWFKKKARDLGTAVHLACQLHDEDDLDLESVEPIVQPRLDAYLKFLADKKPNWLAVELAVEHPVYRYCGTLDRFGYLDDLPTVLDLKGPNHDPLWHGPQTAGYAEALSNEEFVRDLDDSNRIFKRFSLHLRDDGTYRLEPHTNRNDWRVFLACLSLHNWRIEHGKHRAPNKRR